MIFRAVPVLHRKGYFTPFSGKLNGIAQYIQQNLLQLHTVTHIAVVQYRIHNTFVIHVLEMCIRDSL